MQFGVAGRGSRLCFNRTALLAAGFLATFTIYTTPVLAQSDEVPTSIPSASDLASPDAPIVVGPRAAIGTDTTGEKAAKGVVGGVLGGLLGGSDSGRSKDNRPDTIRDPTRKLDFSEIRAMNGGLETGARAMWDEQGLLVSTRLDDAPGKGTFQAVFLQACDGRRIYPVGYEIYKLWSEGSVSVGWSSGTTRDGTLVSEESGSISGSWDDGVGHDEIGGGPAVWSQLGFDRAHHGARQIGARFDATPAVIDGSYLVVHTTLPSQDPVTTAATAWQLAPGANDSMILLTPSDVSAWWAECRRNLPVAVVAGQSPDQADPWSQIELIGLEAKVLRH